MSLGAYGASALPLEVKFVEGTQEPVSLSISGLPAGVTSTFTPGSGTPTFSSILTLAATNAVKGTYPIKIKGTSNTLSKEYSFNLVVTQSCAEQRVGMYSSTSSCDTGIADLQVVAVTGFGNKIDIFDPLDTTQTAVRAELNCDGNTLTVPLQTNNGLTYEGSGSFSANTINMTLTLTFWGSPTVCNFVLTRK